MFSILGAGFRDFAIWLLGGLIVWTLVSTTLSTATQSVTSNQYLVSKVPFPRAVLPLSTLGSALVHFVLQFLTFVVILAVSRHRVDLAYVWLLPIALLVTTVLLAAFALMLGAVNVYARDTQHLLDLALIGLFNLAISLTLIIGGLILGAADIFGSQRRDIEQQARRAQERRVLVHLVPHRDRQRQESARRVVKPQRGLAQHAVERLLGNATAKVSMSSTKSSIGHLLGAAGAVEAIFSVLAIRNQIAPPTINFLELDPKCPVDPIPNTARKMPIRVALSNSFAFGGINASLVVRAL